MFYGKLIDELVSRLKLNPDTSNIRAIAGTKINNAYKEIGNITPVNWPELERYGEIITVPNYATGTVSITQNSRTVTGSNTVFTVDMEGRFFQPSGSANWYKIIKFVSATELTLLSPIIESSNSGLSYTIWKRFYYLPTEVGRIIQFGSWIRDGELTERTQNSLHSSNANLSLTGEPCEFSPYGVDPFEHTYSTGSVSLTKDNNLMTGSGTLWLNNVDAGDLVTVGNNRYRVKRVESDTSIRLINYASADASAETYTINKEQNIGFQLWWNPDSAYLLPYRFRKRVFDMVNETYDSPELPEKFDKAILDGAEADRLADLDDGKWVNKQALYSARVRDLKNSQFVSNAPSKQLRPRITNRGGYI